MQGWYSAFCALCLTMHLQIFENNSFFASLGTHYFTFNTFVFFVSRRVPAQFQNLLSRTIHTLNCTVTFVLDKHLLHDVSAQPSIAILHIPTAYLKSQFLSFCSLFTNKWTSFKSCFERTRRSPKRRFLRVNFSSSSSFSSLIILR